MRAGPIYRHTRLHENSFSPCSQQRWQNGHQASESSRKPSPGRLFTTTRGFASVANSHVPTNAIQTCVEQRHNESSIPLSRSSNHGQRTVSMSRQRTSTVRHRWPRLYRTFSGLYTLPSETRRSLLRPSCCKPASIARPRTLVSHPLGIALISPCPSSLCPLSLRGQHGSVIHSGKQMVSVACGARHLPLCLHHHRLGDIWLG